MTPLMLTETVKSVAIVWASFMLTETATHGKIGYCDGVIHISSGRDTVSSNIAFPA